MADVPSNIQTVKVLIFYKAFQEVTRILIKEHWGVFTRSSRLVTLVRNVRWVMVSWVVIIAILLTLNVEILHLTIWRDLSSVKNDNHHTHWSFSIVADFGHVVINGTYPVKKNRQVDQVLFLRVNRVPAKIQMSSSNHKIVGQVFIMETSVVEEGDCLAWVSMVLVGETSIQVLPTVGYRVVAPN